MAQTDLFANLDAPEPDEILAAARGFAADPRPERINFGIGMYYDETGRVPLMRSVRAAQHRLAEIGEPIVYGPALGSQPFVQAMQDLVFGTNEPPMVGAQTLGGTGALSMGAALLAETLGKGAVVALSAPSWPNHAPLFTRAGLSVQYYRYRDAAGTGFDRDGMLEDLGRLPERSVVVLHAGCHNPTGIDPEPADWPAIIEILQNRNLIAFVDAAYLGFGHGFEADCTPVRLVRASGVPMLLSLTASKSFSLYGARTGCLLVPNQQGHGAAIAAHAAAYARAQYSIPPNFGARLVEIILGDAALRTDWQAELEAMRLRVIGMRHTLTEALAAEGLGHQFAHFVRHHGLFSHSGLSRAQVARLAEDHAMYAVADGRICLPALNDGNVLRVAKAIADVAR